MGLRRFAFTVYDKPVPQARPRFARLAGGGFRTYIPSKDQNSRFNIRGAFLLCPEVLVYESATTQFQPLTGPLRISVTAWVPMPKNIPKKRRLTAYPTSRPDLDNYTKTVWDALQGYAFVDDKQIVTDENRKRYVGTYGGPVSPCWEVILDEIEEI